MATRSPLPSSCFVAGTDTNVGKTLIACALLRRFAVRGLQTIGMKPVAAGCENIGGVLRCEDVSSLIAASNVAAPYDLVNPYALAQPIAPHIAAQQAGVEIDLGKIASAYRQLAQLADVVVVEGVGGFMVPLNADQTTADLAEMLDIPVILVVGLRLGCLSQALLTAEAIEKRGLRLAGWVANQIEPGMPFLTDNISALKHRITAPLLGTVPYSSRMDPPFAADLLHDEWMDGEVP